MKDNFRIDRFVKQWCH